MAKPASRDSVLKFAVGERITITNGDAVNVYRIKSAPTRSRSLASPRDKFSKPLGSGGSGVVYLAEQDLHRKTTVLRATKFFMYSDTVEQKRRGRAGSRSLRTSHFSLEVENLSGFQHENVMRLHAAGEWTHPTSGLIVPAIVTEYVDGPTLEEIIHDKTLEKWLTESAGLVVELMLQLCRGVSPTFTQKASITAIWRRRTSL